MINEMMKKRNSQNIIKKNTIYNILKTLSVVVFPLITFPYVSRVLKPDNIGKVNFGSSIIVYISLLATLGVNTYAVRECSKYREEKEKLNETSGQILSINIITTIIAYTILFLLLLFVPVFYDYRGLILVQSIPIVFTTFGADWLNTIFEDFRYITLRTFVFQIISLIMIFVFVKQPSDYIAYAVILVISSSGASALNIIYRRKYCSPKISWKMNIKKHIPPIMALFVMILAQQVFTACDTTIIGFSLGEYATGLYSTALKIYNIITQVVVSITWVVMPQLSIAYAHDDIVTVKNINKYIIDFTMTLSIPATIGIWIYSKEILLLVAGKEYLPASGAMRVLACAILLTAVSNLLFNINLLSAGRDRVCTIICIVSALMNLVLNIILIPTYGIEAAAFTTALSQIVIIVLSYCFIDKRIKTIRCYESFIKPLVASFVMGIIIIGLKKLIVDGIMALVISIIVGVVIYFMVLLLQKHEFTTGLYNKYVRGFLK